MIRHCNKLQCLLHFICSCENRETLTFQRFWIIISQDISVISRIYPPQIKVNKESIMLMNNPVFFRKSLCHIITVAMLVSLLGSFCMVNAADSYGYSKVCRVTASTLNVRKGAGDTYTKLGMLKKGTYKVILSSKKDKKGTTWYKVYY